MPPKKSAAKAPPKAAKAKESKEVVWLRRQLAALSAQRQAAAGLGADWLEEHHDWHEERLQQLLALSEAGSAEALPDEVREGVEFYVSQFADGAVADQDAFYDGREIYDEVLKQATAEDQAAYVRPEESPEALLVIEQIGAWTDPTQFGMDKFMRLPKQHPESAGVAEAAVKRISAMAADNKERAGTAAAAGLAPKPMLAFIAEVMQRFARDPELQAQCCAAVLSLARNCGDGALYKILEGGGAKLWVQALKQHLQHASVALIVTRAFSYMANPKVCQPHSPEWAMLASSGAEQVLTDVIPYHLTDPRIDKAARTSIPFLRG